MFSTFSRAFRYKFPHLNIHAVLNPCHLANLSMITAGQLSVSVRVCFPRVWAGRTRERGYQRSRCVQRAVLCAAGEEGAVLGKAPRRGGRIERLVYDYNPITNSSSEVDVCVLLLSPFTWVCLVQGATAPRTSTGYLCDTGTPVVLRSC